LTRKYGGKTPLEASGCGPESALKSDFKEMDSRVWMDSYGLDGEFCE
jgi:hypothetical protein